MVTERVVAGVGVSAGAVLLIWRGEYSTALTLLVMLASFFVGEQNGKKKA